MWGQIKRDVSRNIMLCLPYLPLPSPGTLRMLRIKATDLTGLHQRLHADQVRAKKSGSPLVWQSGTRSQAAIVHAQLAAGQLWPVLTSELLQVATFHLADGILTSPAYYICSLLLIILVMWDAEWCLPEQMKNTDKRQSWRKLKGLTNLWRTTANTSWD